LASEYEFDVPLITEQVTAITVPRDNCAAPVEPKTDLTQIPNFLASTSCKF